MLHRRLFAWSVATVLAGAVLALSSGKAEARADAEPHRALRAALFHLKEARAEVKEEGFKKHRERVERDINRAIEELERACREGKIETNFRPESGWDTKYKSYKHLRQALAELDRASEELPKEKGEWARRKELREAVDDARRHVKEALEEVK